MSESSNNIKKEKNNKAKIIIDNKEENLISNISTIKNPSTKKKYFNIEKNIIKNIYWILTLTMK